MARLTKNQAEALWRNLADSFLEFEETLRSIIARKAWTPLGYETFAEAWNAKMSHVRLFPEFRVHVIYALLAEGQSADEIADNVKGAGPSTIEVLDRQRRTGVEPGDATTIVREHDRKLPSKPDTLHIKVGVTMYAEYQRIAGSYPQSVEEICLEAIAARFAEMASDKKRKRGA